MSLTAAFKTLKSRMSREGKSARAYRAEMLDKQAMLDELRGLFADELAAHDRSAREMALESASHRRKV